MRAFLVTLVVATVLGTGAAHAATATLTSASGTISYTAADGSDNNNLSVGKTASGSPVKYTFTDATGVTINASSPCTASGNTGSCPATGVTKLDIDVKDGNNDVALSSAITIASLITGGSGIDQFDGGSGNDTMYGRGSDDRLYGYDGSDTLEGEAGGDWLWGGNGDYDQILGGSGDDHLDPTNAPLSGGPDGNFDLADGGSGSDSWEGYRLRSPGGAFISGAAGSAFYTDGSLFELDRVEHVENLFGTAGNDHIWGDDGPNQLYGFGGDDELEGFGGPDYYFCGNGFPESPGFDVVNYGTRQAPVSVTIGHGPIGDDGESGEGDNVEADCDSVIGGQADDVLVGNRGANVLRGGLGNDTIYGNGGSDTLCGGADNDVMFGDVPPDKTLLGSEGTDYVIGGAGDDVLHGNGGNDLVGGGIFTPGVCTGSLEKGEDGRDTLVGWAGSDILANGAYSGPASMPEVAVGGTEADYYLDASPDSGPDLLLDGFGSYIPESGNDVFLTTDGVSDQIWCGFNDTGDTVVGDTSPAEQLLGGC